MPDDGKLTICPSCKLVYRPDERIYPGSASRCPKCGYDLTRPPPYMRQDG